MSSIILLLFLLPNTSRACLEIPETPPDMTVESCVGFNQFTYLRFLDYATYGANTDEYCVCALNIPFQFGQVVAATIVYANTNTPVDGWNFVADPDSDFGVAGGTWQGFSSDVTEIIPSGIAVDILFVINPNCNLEPGLQNVCCDDNAASLTNWFSTANTGLIGTSGASADGSPIGQHASVIAAASVTSVDPSCTDGIINGDEEGILIIDGEVVNCGGDSCQPCVVQFPDLSDPCTCESNYIASVGFEDVLTINVVPGQSVTLDLNNGGFLDASGDPFAPGLIIEDGSASDLDGIVNGEILFTFYRDQGEVANIVVDGLLFISPAACPALTDCITEITINSCPDDTEVICANQISLGDVDFTTSCNVGGSTAVSSPVVSGTPNCPGTTYTFTYTVTDDCDNMESCDQVFTIDNDGPEIACPTDLTVTCESEIQTQDPIVSVSCGVEYSVTKTGPVVDGDPHSNGTTYTYTFTVTDACGRSASCEQVFTIDNTCNNLDFCAFPAATIINNQYPGVRISTHDNHNRPAMIFDTGNPTGNDFDIGTPNAMYGGPGVGPGYGNDSFQCNALIISKDRHVPNETEGQLIFDFDCAVFVRSIDFIDMECGHNTVTFYDIDHHVIDQITLPQYGENSFHVEEIYQGGVYRMVVDFPCAGGAISDVNYCEDMTPGAMCGACEESTLDFSQHGVDWQLNAMAGNYSIGYQSYDIDITDPDGIFQDSHEDIAGIEIGIDPHDVNDELIISYSLSEVASFVQFDIEDLDFKNGSSKQQEKVCICGFLNGDPTPIYPTVISLDGHVSITNNCAIATTDSNVSHADESVLVTFTECIDEVVIKYGTGPNSPTQDPTYSKMIIGKRVGFTSETCPGDCSDCGLFGDIDEDGICDDCDICLSGDDTLDSDGDGIPDACDSDCDDSVLEGDDDLDGVCNVNDICPGGNDNIDLDGNGVPDACEECEDYKLVFGCSNEWIDDAVSGSYTVLDQQFDISIMNMDNILELTGQDGFGLNVGIEPNDVDDIVTVKYNLSQVVNYVKFDIVDLDYKNGNSKQQEGVCIYGLLDSSPVEIMPTIRSLDGSVSINGNCAEGTVNSAHSNQDESILVEFNDCIDQIVIQYGTGTNSPVANPSYSNITIGQDLGFSTQVCEHLCFEASVISGGPFAFVAGDGQADVIMESELILDGGIGSNSAWVITDANGNILQIADSIEDIDFESFDSGNVLIWNLVYEDDLQGAEVGANANDLTGTFELSNSIEVVRDDFGGGDIAGGPFSFVAGDSQADVIMESDLIITGAVGSNSAIVITDTDGNILQVADSIEDVDFESFDSGNVLIWNLVYEDDLQGADVGANAADLTGTFSLSNSIEVVRDDFGGGEIAGGPFSFVAGDAQADVILESDLTITGAVGSNSAIVITDTDGNILQVADSIEDVDFESFDSGNVLIWNLVYEDDLQGADVGANAADLTGTFELSNSIEVVRDDFGAGQIAGGPFEFIAGDAQADIIMVSELIITGGVGSNSAIVITDTDGNILQVADSIEDVDFDSFESGNVLIWNLVYEDDLQGADVGANAADLTGTYALSNSIEVVRIDFGAGQIAGGPFQFSVGDGQSDFIMAGELSLTGAVGSNSSWLITDAAGNILTIAPSAEAIDFDVLPAGSALIWHLIYENGLQGAVIGANAADLSGTYALSNSIDVMLIEACPDTLMLNGNATNQNFQVSQLIQSNQTVIGPDVKYDAGNCIILESGFEVTSGALFEALIEGCNN